NTKELERLQKIAFDVENNTLNSLVSNGDITTNILDNYMRYAERTQVYKQSSLIQRIKVELKTFILKSRIKTKVRTNAASSLSVIENLREISNV
ncbi:sodium:proton antiporter, partial [Mesorhizobium sp. M8A.F.Ca.ET.208.01.1.1]